MLRRLSLTQLLKNSGAYVAVSASTVDVGLFVADRLDVVNVPFDWYIDAPLMVWVVVGVPVSLTLAGRVLQQVDPRARRIVGFQEGVPSPLLRKIGFNTGGKSSTILANRVDSIFGDKLPEVEEYRPAVWHVPVEDIPVIVRESELRAFLEVCYKRVKYQFSRRYWTKRRRPPVIRAKYEAYMRLLVESGLVEGRYDSGGASGYLATIPRSAITFLKYESAYRV